MITQILNKSEVEKLFEKEAVFISAGDVVPVYKAEILFGKEATDHAQQKGGEDYNIYSLGATGKEMRYLYYKGFKKAATYCNIANILDSFKPASEKEG